MKTFLRMVLIFASLFITASVWTAEAVSVVFENTADEIDNVSSCAAPFAYIANYWGNTVSVIDTGSNTVTATVPVGDSPMGVAINPAGTLVYVTNEGTSTVSVIDTGSNTVTATVPVGLYPFSVAVNPSGTRVYVTNRGGNTTSVIDTSSNTVTATVLVGGSPEGVAVNPAGTLVYVANSTSNTVSVIDTGSNTVTATVPVGTYPIGVAVNPSGTRVYVVNGGGNTVSVIDTGSNTVTATIPVGTAPDGVAVNPAGTRVYVANYTSNDVSVIDTGSNTVIATVPVGTIPYGIAVNPAGTKVYVANAGSDNVSVIDTGSNTVTATIPVGSHPFSLGQFIGAVDTASCVEPPSAPSNLIATTVSSTRIELGWKDNATNETGFIIQRKEGTCASANTWAQIAKPGADVIAYPNIALTANTQYSYRIKAYNTSGNSAYSNCATATTASAKPLAPTTLTATAVSASRIDLGWKDNSSNETGFKLERKTGGCASTNAWAQITTPAADVITYPNTGLSANTKYSYRVRAYNASGNSAYSNCAAATTEALAPKLTSVSPNPAKVGATVTISGTRFGPTQGTSTVAFNGTVATASSWSGTKIIATVPEGATTGNVVVTVNGIASNGLLLTVPTFTTTVNPSASAQTVSYKGVSITIPGGLLTQPEMLKIIPKTAPNLNSGPMVGLDSYDITLGQKKEFSQTLTLKFKYDKTKLDSALPEGKGLVVGYWDTDLNQWVTVEHSVNTSTQQVIVKTKHLSTWIYWTLRGFSYVSSIEKHFDVYYYSSAPSPLPGYTMRQLAVAAKEYLEHAYTNYAGPEGTGFRVPGFVNAVISYTFDDSEMSPWSGNIFLKAAELTSLTKLKNDTAHELFHIVQNRYFNIYAMGYRMWWIEGTPDYAASKIAWESTIPLDPAELDAFYFDESMIAADKAHAYQLDQFLEYLVTKKGIDFKGMWDYVFANSLPTALSAFNTLQLYIGDHSADTFDAIWEDYVVFSFLDASSSMTENALGLNGTVIMKDGATTATKALDLPATYTAKGFRVRATAPEGGGKRIVTLESLTDFPAGTHVEIYRLIGGKRAGGYTLLQVLTTKAKSNPIELSSTDALFVLAMNESNSDQKVSIKVSSGPVITSLNPTSGQVGNTVTITGTGFGAAQSTSTVTFNGTVASITSWSDTSIKVTVPNGATTGNIVVTVGGAKSNGKTFTISTILYSLYISFNLPVGYDPEAPCGYSGSYYRTVSFSQQCGTDSNCGPLTGTTDNFTGTLGQGEVCTGSISGNNLSMTCKISMSYFGVPDPALLSFTVNGAKPIDATGLSTAQFVSNISLQSGCFNPGGEFNAGSKIKVSWY